MQRFADVTKRMATTGNVQRVKRCLQIAENIFNQGGAEIKNAVSNVYVFSVSSFMQLNHHDVKRLFPNALLNEYKKQINTSGL